MGNHYGAKLRCQQCGRDGNKGKVIGGLMVIAIAYAAYVIFHK